MGRMGASDANNGGAPGTVADKVNGQMAGHRQKAMAMLASALQPGATPQAPPAPMGASMTGFPPRPAPMVPQMAQAAPQAPQVPAMQPSIISASAPPPQAMPQAPQAPMSAYQRMMATSLGKDGGIDDPRNRAIAQQAGLRPAAPMGVPSPFTGRTQAPMAPQGAPMSPGMAPQAAPMAPSGDPLTAARAFILSPTFQDLPEGTQALVLQEYQRMQQAALPPDP